MKRKRPWKPGGHPRRTAGSMSLNRRKAQQITRRNGSLRKGETALGAGS
jgi:hypothetical protein